jgi:cytochrome c oxidase accessory protein FixG
MMRAAPGEHWTAFVFVTVLAGVLYFNFAWFREQMCLVICPYGRLQSALIDEHSLVIGYDQARGEPRGPRGTGATGDCVACNRCVQVCPTGIDIRHGLQIECIGCAACIDACDEIMAKVGRPAGLVRYDSLAGFSGGRTRWLRPRTVLYGVLLGVGVAVAAFALSTVKPAAFSVVRMSGAAYFVDKENVRNQFLVRLLNKQTVERTLTVAVTGLPPGVRASGFERPVTVAPMAEQVSPLVLSVDRGTYSGPFDFTVQAGDMAGTFQLARAVRFLGPDPMLLKEADHEKQPAR